MDNFDEQHETLEELVADIQAGGATVSYNRYNNEWIGLIVKNGYPIEFHFAIKEYAEHKEYISSEDRHGVGLFD